MMSCVTLNLAYAKSLNKANKKRSWNLERGLPKDTTIR